MFRLFLFLFICIINVNAQKISRYKGESADSFILRIKPSSSILYDKVIETSWNNTSVIIAFLSETYLLPLHDDPQQTAYTRVIATLYASDSYKKNYIESIIDTLIEEESPPKIEHIFFANADNDKEKELIILTTWDINNSSVHGKLYSTSIYDYTQKLPKKLLFLNDISSNVNGGCDCIWEIGRIHKSIFKSKADIINGLQSLGYIQ
jgi:hypothetical protein